jgi:N utilization substance protein A
VAGSKTKEKNMSAKIALTGGSEILQVAESIAREKSLKRDSVIGALEDAVASVARKKYGYEQNIRVEISERDGSIRVFRDLNVVETPEDINTEISPKHAKLLSGNDIEIGGTVSEELPPIDFGRVASQTFKQVVTQKIREAEREKQFDDFKDRVGEIVTGVVKRIENNGDIIIDFGKTETILQRNHVIPRENYKINDRIRAYIVDVKNQKKGHQIYLSRTNNNFLAQLFAQEVPEIYDGLVQIKGVARDPGSRAKIAVNSDDRSIDPVGSCIGPRGSRVTAVYNELQGEKIDIIEWSDDLATLAVNAIGSKTRDSMVEVLKIVIDEDNNKLIAVVPDEHLSLAIGRRGQNVRLASQLIGWNIEIISETDESKRATEEFARLTKTFCEALNVEEVIGQLLASQGFTNLEEVAYCDKSDLLSIEGFEDELVGELQKRAEEFLQAEKEKAQQELKDAGVEESVFDLPNITDKIIIGLSRNKVKTISDVADLSRDEFRDIAPQCGLTNEQIDEIIMQAREKSGMI